MAWQGMWVRRAERQSPLWLWPAVGSVIAFVAALFIVDVPLPASLRWLAWPGGAESARALLEVVTASVITVTALTFSVTVLALQLASQQFSPRLLRDFTRDRVIKAVLTVFISTFVFTATVLREASPQGPLPHLAILTVAALGLAALAAVLAFVAHIARILRVDTMMRTVHQETDRVIATFYPRHGDPGTRSPDEIQLDRAHGTKLCAPKSGFVRTIDVRRLVRTAQRHDVVVAVEVRPGDHVVRGTPIATAWGRDGSAPDTAALEHAIKTGIRVGYERTAEQDAAFGFRQLTDVAVKALSPGINDPVTAGHAIGHMSDLLVKLAARDLGAILHADADGRPRVVVPDRDFRYYLDLACGPIRRYGRNEPIVLVALLRMLRDVAAMSRDDNQRSELARQTDLIVAEVPGSLSDDDVAQVVTMGERVRQALCGRITEAYGDRSGETRSI